MILVAARIKREAPIEARLVIFDRAAYDGWRGGAPDTRAARQEWAVARSLTGTRYAIKLGGRTAAPVGADGQQMSAAWAVWRYGPTTPPARVEAGRINVGAPKSGR